MFETFDWFAAVQVAIMCVVTLALRALPFLIFGGKAKTPKFVLYLGRVLPGAMIAMLVVYCLRGTSFGALVDWLPALISVAVLVVLHVWKRSSLLSILGSTALYVLLVHVM